MLRWTITLTYLVSSLTNFNTMLFVQLLGFLQVPQLRKIKSNDNMTAEKKKSQQDKVAKCNITRLPASPAAEKNKT